MIFPPRRLLTGMTLLLAVFAGGCVAQTRYVQTRDALVREQAGHHETAEQLHATGVMLVATERERDDAARVLHDRQEQVRLAEQKLAELELDVNVAAQEREEAVRLVEQLRGELGRVAGHLRAFSDQRDALQSALDAAEGRLHQLAEMEREAAQRSMLVRDLALALHRPVATGEVELAVVEGRPVLRVPTARVFPETSAEVVDPDGDALLAAVAQVASSHPGVSIHLTELGVVPGPEASAARLGEVSSRLVDHGVARSQILVAVPPTERAELAQAMGDAEPGRLELQLLVAAGS
jgi:hypothetical protein